MALLDLSDVTVSIGALTPLDRIAFSIEAGEIIGVVGESGSGKSLTAMAVMGLLPLIGGRITSGAVRFADVELNRLPERDYRALRGRRIALISQNPMTSLDPIRRVGEQIDQVSMMHLGLGTEQARLRSVDMMRQLRIPEADVVHGNYPHQLSGGMKQRIVIAMALAADPELIVADEPTTALDVTIQAQIIQIMVEMARRKNVALMLITHDMGVVAQACDRVVVLYAGRVAETGSVERIFAAPRHPYTKSLIGCIPVEGLPPGGLKGIDGVVPGVANYPTGCRFHPRCSLAQDRCKIEAPLLRALDEGAAACHLAGDPP
ncbi:MAG: ABC transporter ATP-binding protein [Hyphomicrobiales bacterium]|nr:ABC transporter ATP-binding protein [Hyphomicrobiales bacterium]